jgi:uncharacterized protein YjgD (DUF1641 family)
MSQPKEQVTSPPGEGSAAPVNELVRVLEGARDALSDDIVNRLSATVGDGLDLLDRINRSGVAQALPAISALVESGDLERLVQLARVVGSAQDAMSDDIVGRLSATLGDGMDLLDRVNRSQLAAALPTINRMVESGDLERVSHLARVLGAAEDAMSEEMVGRLAGTVTEGLDLLDRVNRSGIVKALPTISALVESGDLDRIVQLARVVGSAEDAVNDEMIARMAGVFSEGLCLMDRLTRNGALSQVLDLLLREEVQGVLVRFGEALLKASEEFEQQPPPKGGIGGLWKIMSQPGNQQALQFMGLFGKHLREETN